MIRFAKPLLLAAAITTNAIAFSKPLQFAEASQALEVRTALPTSLTSEQLSQLPAELLERATLSARVESTIYLDEIDRILGQLVNGEISESTAYLALKDKLDELNYQPSPDEEGSITDFSSFGRRALVIDTNLQMAQGYGRYIQGQDQAILDHWPAQELYRAAEAQQPRNWVARWQNEGGEVFGGRMIALKNTGIWTAISRFGLPYPPFDYGSHMRVRDVTRDTAISLGLIDADTKIEPETRDFNQDLKISADIRSDYLRQALLDSDPRLTLKDGVLTLGGNG
jgi:hypothetical protein